MAYLSQIKLSNTTYDVKAKLTEVVLNDTSNWGLGLQWRNTTLESETYLSGIGRHNTGGNSTYPGSISIIPYATNVEPWGGTAGLFLSKDAIKFENQTLLHSGNYSSILDGRYVNITGDTMTGALNFQNNILNKVGDDSAFGDQDQAGHFVIQGLNGTTALGFKEYGATNIASVYSNGTKIWTGANALLPCWSTLTGGNANVAGWRLIGSHALGAWHNNRANFIINSRHTGNGLLSIAYGCNAGEINQANVYCDVVISGNNSGAGSIWNNNAFKCYYNSTNNYLYFFWYYTDYNTTDIISFGSPISDFYPQDGTWVETIDAATYGVEITTLRRSWNQGDAVTGAVWNDYAECRQSDCEEFGYVLMEVGDDSLTKTTERLSHFAGVSSDTWGFSQGETDKAKTPIAVAGRVLVYPYQDRNNYKPGDCVCAAPGGTVDIMTREEVREWPDRIVGTVSCVPNYEEWGGGEGADRDPVKVNGRIWIKVK